MKAIIKIEKYDDNVTQEDIIEGKAKPKEILYSEDNFETSEENVKNLINKGGNA